MSTFNITPILLKADEHLYDNSQTVDDEKQILADFHHRSLLCYQKYPHLKDIRYSEHPRSTIDIFPCSPAIDNVNTTVVFVHGGYWQWCNKSDFAFIAEYVLQQNCSCVLIEYDLAPHSTLLQIHSQIKQALDFISQQPWITSNVLLVGHSAGAHLAALHMQHSLVSSGVLLSGIYDLAPIQKTHLNAALQLTDVDIERLSPINNEIPVNKPYWIIYGDAELVSLKWQSVNYFHRRTLLDRHWAKLLSYKGVNHYTILDYFFKHRIRQVLS